MGTLPIVPEQGILSRTLSSSPTTYQILPARIRAASRNDVIFVGDTSIQLREYLENGQLAEATGKLDLHAQIMAARVISAKIVVKDTLDAILQQSGEEETYLINGRAISGDLPPQILVLSTSTCELLYIYAKESSDTTVNFVLAKRPLLRGISLAERFGAHLAVDPESRAIAVASSIGQCAVFALKGIDQIKAEIDSWKPGIPDSFKPTTEQRFIQVDGLILRMDFLCSPQENRNKVILLILVANNGVTRLLLYQWDSRLSLTKLYPMRCSGQTLQTSDSPPLMLIPSSINSSFMLITETDLVVYDDITANQTRRIQCTLPQGTANNSVSGNRVPLWTQWAKPRRHTKYKDTHDDFFLVREDGLLGYCLINHKLSTRLDAHFSPGTLNMSVNTAFCILAAPQHIGGDVIVAGGSMNDGGVYHLAARGSPQLRQTLANHSPIRDMILHEARSLPAEDGDQPDRIFACCGNGNGSGSIAEFSPGLEAQVGWVVDLQDAVSIQRMWSIEVEKLRQLWLFTSHHVYTSLYIFHLSRHDVPESADSGSHPGLNFDSVTLAVGMVQNQVVVQITPREINLFSISETASTSQTSPNGLQYFCAEFLDANGHIVIAHESQNGYVLSLVHVRKGESGQYHVDLVHMSQPVGSRPVSLCSCRIGSAQVVVLATEVGELRGYDISADETLDSIFVIHFANLDPSLKRVVTSSTALLTTPYTETGLLLCGMRNGLLVCLAIRAVRSHSTMNFVIQLDGIHRVRSTAVAVCAEKQHDSGSSSALVSSENVLRRISLLANNAGIEYGISDIWLTSRSDLSSLQPVVSAVHRIQRVRSVEHDERSDLLVCATEGELLFTSLLAQSQAVVRRVPVTGNPRRIAFSRYLGSLVVGVDGSSLTGLAISRSVQTLQTDKPHIRFVSIDKPRLMLRDEVVLIGETGETIRSLLNWSPTDGKTHYEMIVVAINKDEAGSYNRSGRIAVLSASKIKKGEIAGLKARTLLHFVEKPVTAICPIKLSSLLIANSSEIVLHSLDLGTRKWSTLSSYPLPSQALSLYAQGSLIFIATVHHSLHMIREHKDELKFYASDTGTKYGTNVLAYNGTTSLISTVSDKGSTLTAFAEDRASGGLYKIFAANMPLIIDCIQEEGASAARNARRQSFCASVTDGTLYHFITLKPEEWKLLDFLEDLCHVGHRSPKGAAKSKKTALEVFDEEPRRISPAAMHIRGDVIQMLIGPGPYNLHQLMGPMIKAENEHAVGSKKEQEIQTLRNLAEPLLGQPKDIIGAVIIWIRKLLRYPRTM